MQSVGSLKSAFFGQATAFQARPSNAPAKRGELQASRLIDCSGAFVGHVDGNEKSLVLLDGAIIENGTASAIYMSQLSWAGGVLESCRTMRIDAHTV
jgi:hypothetical protein